jgi:hypothetical protein
MKMFTRWAWAVGLCLLAPAAAAAQSWQKVDVRVDLAGAPELTTQLGTFKPVGLARELVAMLDGELVFWQLQVATRKGKLPLLTIDLFEQQGGTTVQSRQLYVRLTLTSPGITQTLYRSEELLVVARVEYADLLVNYQEEDLAREVVGRVRKEFQRVLDACEERFHRIPVAEGVIDTLPPDRLIVPLEHGRFGPYALSTFEVEIVLAGQPNLLLFRGLGRASEKNQKLYLVLQQEKPPLPKGARYKRIWLKIRDLRPSSDTEELRN